MSIARVITVAAFCGMSATLVELVFSASTVGMPQRNPATLVRSESETLAVEALFERYHQRPTLEAWKELGEQCASRYLPPGDVRDWDRWYDRGVKLRKEYPDDAWIPYRLAWLKRARAGDRQAGVPLWQEAAEIYQRKPEPRERSEQRGFHYDRACMLSLAERYEEAIIALAQSIELGWTNGAHARRDPDLGPLRRHESDRLKRGEPDRFVALIDPIDASSATTLSP